MRHLHKRIRQQRRASHVMDVTGSSLWSARSSLPSHKQRGEAVRSSTNSLLSSLTLTNSKWLQSVERQLVIARPLAACPQPLHFKSLREKEVCSALSSPRCAPAPVYWIRNETKSAKKKKKVSETAWHFTVASRYFVAPANTLLLNLCLHTRRASGKGAHPPYILKETHSRVVTHWFSARCRNGTSDA